MGFFLINTEPGPEYRIGVDELFPALTFLTVSIEAVKKLWYPTDAAFACNSVPGSEIAAMTINPNGAPPGRNVVSPGTGSEPEIRLDKSR